MVLLGMAVLTVVEAGIGIMVSMYNSMSDRRHEIAVMRALGASRDDRDDDHPDGVDPAVVDGRRMGLLLAHGAIWLCSPLIADWTGVVVGLMQFQSGELLLIPGLIVLASAVGYLPALAAYRTDVAKSLITTPVEDIDNYVVAAGNQFDFAKLPPSYRAIDPLAVASAPALRGTVDSDDVLLVARH